MDPRKERSSLPPSFRSGLELRRSSIQEDREPNQRATQNTGNGVFPSSPRPHGSQYATYPEYVPGMLEGRTAPSFSNPYTMMPSSYPGQTLQPPQPQTDRTGTVLPSPATAPTFSYPDQPFGPLKQQQHRTATGVSPIALTTSNTYGYKPYDKTSRPSKQQNLIKDTPKQNKNKPPTRAAPSRRSRHVDDVAAEGVFQSFTKLGIAGPNDVRATIDTTMHGVPLIDLTGDTPPASPIPSNTFANPRSNVPANQFADVPANQSVDYHTNMQDAEAYLRASTEHYQCTRLMGESNWEETTTMLANDTEMADAVDSNGDTMHNFLEEQMYFGDY